ncbi:MAG: 3'-5' exonuclease [Bacillota bacterium]|nr:3'-5' exonuclease [Bacillota bacterium]
MGTCKMCNKSGLFFKVDEFELCLSCMQRIKTEAGPIVEKLQYDMNAYDKYNREDIKYDCAKRMVPNFEQLLKYEKMGIPILNGKVGTVSNTILKLTAFINEYEDKNLVQYKRELRTKKSIKEFKKTESYVVVDFETTGFNPQKDRIIEIGIVKVQNGNIVDTFNMLINPCIKIPDEISHITGITDEMVKNQPKLSDVLTQMNIFIDNNCFISHNALFDASFYKTAVGGKLPASFTYIDTLDMVRNLYPELKNHKLDTLIKLFSLPVDSRHRALSDAISTQALFEKCLSDILEEVKS